MSTPDTAGTTLGALARDGGGRPVLVLQISDTHLYADPERALRGVVTDSTFRAVLAHARKDPHWPADAVVVTGDVVHDESRTGYERFARTLSDIGVPAYCIPGNHDDPSILAECATSAGLQVCGDAALKHWRIVLLNSFVAGEVGGELGTNELDRLRRVLANATREHVLICMHHHPLPVFSAWMDQSGLRDAPAFLEIVAQHPCVRAVIWGHVHQASDRCVDGVRYMSCPSTCSQFRPRSEEFAVDDRPPGMRWLALWPDGGLTTEIVHLTTIAGE